MINLNDKNISDQNLSLAFILGSSLLVAIISGIVGYAVHLDFGQHLILILVSEILTFVVEITFVVRGKKEAHVVELVIGENDIRAKATSMKNMAQDQIYAMWCVMRYGPSLQQYFEQFRGNFILRRLINVKKMGSKNVTEHLLAFQKELKSGKYIVTSTTHQAYECLVVDRKQALFLCPHHVTGAMHLGLFSMNDHYVSTIIATFEKLEGEGTRLEIPEGTTDAHVKEIIEQWVNM